MEINKLAMAKVIFAGLRQKPLIIFIKLAITVAAFVVLAHYIDLHLLMTRVRAVDPMLFGCAIAMAVVQVALVGFRWRLILASMAPPSDFVPPLGEIQTITWTSQLFNQFMPFAVGDMLRILLLHQAGTSLRVSFKSTLLDRAIAALVLLVLSVTSLLITPPSVAASSYYKPMFFGVIGATVAAVIVIALAEPISKLCAGWRVISAVTETLDDMRRLFMLRTYGISIIGLCVLVHCVSILIFFTLAQGLSAPLSIRDSLVIVPLMLLVSLIPVSLGGWGVREGFVILLFVAEGISSEVALLLSLSFGAVILIAALPGVLALIFSVRPRMARPPSDVQSCPRIPAE